MTPTPPLPPPTTLYPHAREDCYPDWDTTTGPTVNALEAIRRLSGEPRCQHLTSPSSRRDNHPLTLWDCGRGWGKGCNRHSKQCRRCQPLVNSDRQQRCVTRLPPIPGHPHLRFRNIGGTYNHAVGRTQLADPSSPPCESLCEAVVAVAPRCRSSPHAHRSARSADRAASLSAAASLCCKRPTLY